MALRLLEVRRQFEIGSRFERNAPLGACALSERVALAAADRIPFWRRRVRPKSLRRTMWFHQVVRRARGSANPLVALRRAPRADCSCQSSQKVARIRRAGHHSHRQARDILLALARQRVFELAELRHPGSAIPMIGVADTFALRLVTYQVLRAWFRQLKPVRFAKIAKIARSVKLATCQLAEAPLAGRGSCADAVSMPVSVKRTRSPLKLLHCLVGC